MNKKTRIIAVIWFWICFAAIIAYIGLAKNYLDSDMASEMILAKMCAEDNVIMSRNWYYSTEIRLINMNLPMTFFFHFFKDFLTIRVLSSIVMLGIVPLSYMYCMKQAGLNKSAVYYVSLLVLPFSSVFYQFGLAGLHYSAYIMAVFYPVGFVFKINNPAISGKKKLLPWVMYILFAVLMGLTTIRQLLVIYYPFAFACFLIWLMDYVDTYGVRVLTIPEIKENIISRWRENKYLCYFLTACVGALTASVAYVGNVAVLRRIYDFSSYDRIVYTNVDDFARFSEVILGHARVLGYEVGYQFLSVQGICNILVIVFVCFLVWLTYRMIKNNKKFELRQRIIIIYFACAVIFNDFIFMFSDRCGDRYMLPYLLFFIPVLCIFTEDERVHSSIRRLVYVCVMGLFIVNSICKYSESIKAEEDTGRDEAVQFLVDNDYDFGYATYWNGNVLTELTNGKIEVRNVNIQFWETMHCDKWLMKKDMEYRTSDHKVFILLTQDQYEDNSSLEMFSDKYLVYDNKGYEIFEYPNTQELWSMVKPEEDAQ
jgi:hypothetical protein